MKVGDIRYHEQILFVLVFSVLIYGAFYSSSHSKENQIKGGLAASAVLIAEGTLQVNAYLFQRPNMAFWRGLSRVCLIYLIFLVFLIYQTPTDARLLFAWFDPSLNKPLTHEVHTYDEKCDLTYENLMGNFDHYFIVHCVNWFLAAFVCRDVYVLLFWQALDEIIELSAQHILPHLAECWWDHIVGDMLMANIPAIFLGMWVLRMFNIQPYDWLGRLDSNGNNKPIKQWKIFHCHRYVNALCNILVIITLNFLCGFFMINTLWIPPLNLFNRIRLLVWFALANLAFKECYQDISTWGTEERRTKPVSGQFRWLLASILLIEVFCCGKFLENCSQIHLVPTPIYIWLPWTSAFVTGYGWYAYLRLKKNHTTKYPKVKTG